MKTIPLSDVTLFVRNGASIKQSKITHDGYPITRIETLSNGIFNYDKMGFASIKDDKYKDFYLKNNDVLLSHINSEKFLGRSVLYINHGEGPIIHGMNLLNIRFDQQKYTPSFFVWYTKSAKAKNFFRENTKHAVNQASIASSAIKSMPVPDVPLDYQETISNSLNQIEKTIHSKQNLLCSLDSLVKSLFVEMFGDPDLSSQKKEWSLVTSFSRIVTGTTPSTSDPDNWNGNILWVTPAEIKKDEFFMYDTERKITEKGKTSKSLSLMPIGTVILSTRAPIGKVAIVGKEMTCNQGFKNFICNKNVDPVYLYFLLKFNSEYLNSIGSGTTFKEISKSKIESLKMPIPPIKLQNEFATFVKLIDKSKFVCHSRYFLWLCLTLESSTMAYSSVVSIFECPKRRWTCSIGIPLSIAFVANVRRNL